MKRHGFDYGQVLDGTQAEHPHLGYLFLKDEGHVQLVRDLQQGSSWSGFGHCPSCDENVVQIEYQARHSDVVQDTRDVVVAVQ